MRYSTGFSSVAAALLLAIAAAFELLGCGPAGLDEPHPVSVAERESPFPVGPYLLRPTPGTMMVVVKADQRSPPVTEWWELESELGLTPPSPERIQRVSADKHVDQWVSTLEGLPLDRPLAYRVRGAKGDAGPFRFKAGASRGSRFTFAVFGDTRTGHSVHRSVIERVAQERVDFFVHTGDMVESGGLDPAWDLFFRIEQPLVSFAPIVPAIGNHDMGPRDLFGEVFLTTLWTDSFSYYFHDWGDLRIVVLDTGIECRTGCTQSLFARRALADGAKKGMLLAISLHYPPYSSGAHGSYLGVREAVGELARRYGVELVFAGHDHNYERTKPIDGTYYVVAAAAGAPVRPVHPRWFSSVVRTEAHYVLVDVARERMTLRAINLDGETFDQVVIDPVSPRDGSHEESRR
jgi:hypothetical protein